jgi:hypothetical protein
MGCVEGGTPDCPTLGELYCSDGAHANLNYIMDRMSNGFEGKYMCKDGKMPICKETRDRINIIWAF